MDLSVLLTPIEGSLSGVVRHGEFMIVRPVEKAQPPDLTDDRPRIGLTRTADRIASGLQNLNPLREEKRELLKLAGPGVLEILTERGDLEGVEVFVRIRAAGTSHEGMFAYIIPPDDTHKLEIHRGESEKEAVLKGRRSKRVLSGALFIALDHETIAEIAQRE